ncbi:MAG: TIGR04282 family arsenosugar biosynthesis glycosyltransferase [Anditalea sp.]
MKKEDAIIIFQKKPERGKVKTRLAKTIGDEKAVEVYQYLLDHTHQQVALLHVPTFVFFDKEVQPEFLRNRNYHSAIQSPGNLGEKMKSAFQEVFDQGYQKAVIIGTDCKELEAEILSGAINSLESHDLVIGPALDGGYYLLGMKKIHPPLFENKEWSSSTVFSDSMKDVKNLGLDTCILKELSDVDIYEDMGDRLKVILGID